MSSPSVMKPFPTWVRNIQACSTGTVESVESTVTNYPESTKSIHEYVRLSVCPPVLQISPSVRGWLRLTMLDLQELQMKQSLCQWRPSKEMNLVPPIPAAVSVTCDNDSDGKTCKTSRDRVMHNMDGNLLDRQSEMAVFMLMTFGDHGPVAGLCQWLPYFWLCRTHQ